MGKRLDAQVREEDGNIVIGLEGRLEDVSPGALGALVDSLPDPAGRRVVIDLDGVERFGGLGTVAVTTLAGGIEERGGEVRIKVADESQRRTIETYGREVPEPEDPGDEDTDLVDRLGERTLRLRETAFVYLWILLSTLKHAGKQLIGRGGRRFDHSVRAVVRMGVTATPLVALISALIGSIMALHSAKILRMWSQEIRVADLVGLTMTKEIGPLLTAILVAGRSGSSLTAEIGTMKVSEEVDALEVMGVPPVGYLVAPRLLAMLLVLPALTIIADVVGIAGGLMVGVTALDLSRDAYLAQTLVAVKSGAVLGGLLKAVLFGIVIVSVAAHQGFATAGGAAGVGKYTTRSVVLAIIWIIVVDAVFTTVQYLMD